jgi:hypothetical protein
MPGNFRPPETAEPAWLPKLPGIKTRHSVPVNFEQILDKASAVLPKETKDRRS